MYTSMILFCSFTFYVVFFVCNILLIYYICFVVLNDDVIHCLSLIGFTGLHVCTLQNLF